jgi:hypothetical protein
MRDHLVVRNEEPTESEARFFEALSAKVPNVQDWYHRDANGALWMIVSYDLVDEQNRVRATLRCDFDGDRLKAGSSPGFLNWDDGVRADDAGMDLSALEALDARVTTPGSAAEIAAAWFHARIAAIA